MMFGEVISLRLLGWMIYHLIIQCVFKLVSFERLSRSHDNMAGSDLFQLQVWLSRMDGHMGVANSLAMKIAGIDKNTNDPIGGTIMRTTEGGNATDQYGLEPYTSPMLLHKVNIEPKHISL